VSAILPEGWGYWPAFWLYNQNTSYCKGWYNEIDYLELDGQESSTGKVIGENYHWFDSTATSCSVATEYPYFIDTLTSTTSVHKYAVLWSPENFSIYFDGNVVRNVYDPINIPTHAMYPLLDMVADEYWGNAPKPGTTLPAYLQINCFNIYQLDTACSTSENFCSTAFNSSTYTYAVKDSIKIGGVSCTSSSTINTSSEVTLWATDFVCLGAGTTINANGSGYFAIKTTEGTCPGNNSH
jgi:beta-glucanase (GH16 family)